MSGEAHRRIETTVDSAPQTGARCANTKRARAYMVLAYAVVSAPVLTELLRKSRSSFYPTADNAVEAIRAHDVFSSRTPLVGLYSGISNPARHAVFHLGPMLFWALAIPERVFSERMGIAIAAAIVNIVAAMALLRSVRRMYGSNGLLVAAAISLVTVWSLGRNTLAEPWSPYIALIPLMLVFVYSLELGNGALRPLPWAVLTASFVVQSHYVYIAVLGASLAAGIVFGIFARRRESLTTPRVPVRDRRAVFIAAAVAFVCWLPPALDMILHWPGNLPRWAQALQHTKGGQMSAADAWHYMTRSIGWIPLVVRGPLPGSVLSSLPSRISTSANGSALIAVTAVYSLAVALRRREPRAARFAAIAGVLIFALTFTIWRLPLVSPLLPTYRILSLWPVSGFVWTAVIVGLIKLLASSSNRLRLEPTRGVSWVLTILAIVASLVAVRGGESGSPVDHSDWEATRAVAGPTLERLSHSHRYVIRADGDLAYFVQYGIMRAMLSHGYTAVLPANDVYLPEYHADDRAADYTVFVTSRRGPLPSEATLIAHFDPNTPAMRARLRHARDTALRALRSNPMKLTSYGEQQRRRSDGKIRSALDAVALGTETPEQLLDATLGAFVYFGRADPNGANQLFVVGQDVVPTFDAYAHERDAIESHDVRVALIPSGLAATNQ